MFLPPELYSWLFWFPYYYGDHIEWDTLESFSIAAEVEKLDWLIKDFAYKHSEVQCSLVQFGALSCT